MLRERRKGVNTKKSEAAKENYLWKIEFPCEVITIAKVLEKHGYKAYAVGGCVRDSVMGRTPSDWDMTTDAHPDAMLEIFNRAGLRTIPTGLKHGTVTVIINGKPFEITTFRIDGAYTDSRRPDSVTFSSNIVEDLRRRDFTVNAMAADPLFSDSEDGFSEIIDPFGGLDDVKNKIIRCVGNPSERFAEDALRILRAVRFSSALGFEIEAETRLAAARLSHRLADISAERKAVELEKTLLSDNADVGFDALCVIGATEHIHSGLCKPPVSLTSLPRSFFARLAALIEGDDPPSLASMKLAGEVSRKATLIANRKLYLEYSRYFGDNIRANARYMISKYKGAAESAAALRGDSRLLAAIYSERTSRKLVTEISGLKINGNSLMAIGIPQKTIGKLLSALLIEVIRDPSFNSEEELIRLAKIFSERENGRNVAL